MTKLRRGLKAIGQAQPTSTVAVNAASVSSKEQVGDPLYSGSRACAVDPSASPSDVAAGTQRDGLVASGAAAPADIASSGASVGFVGVSHGTPELGSHGAGVLPSTRLPGLTPSVSLLEKPLRPSESEPGVVARAFNTEVFVSSPTAQHQLGVRPDIRLDMSDSEHGGDHCHVRSDREAHDSQAGPPTRAPPSQRVSRSSLMADKTLPRLLLVYSSYVVRCPLCFVLWYLLALVLVLYGLWRPVEFDENLASFARADGQALRNYDAWVLAQEAMPQLEATGMAVAPAGSTRQLSAGHFGRVLKAFAVYYSARDGTNMLDPKVLREVRDIESGLRAGPRWQHFCRERSQPNLQWLCDPGESFVAFSWPSQTAWADDAGFTLNFTGNGTELLLPQVSLRYLSDWSSGLLELPLKHLAELARYFSKEFVFGTATLPPKSSPPKEMRSRFSFAIALGVQTLSPYEYSSLKSQITQDFSAFIAEEAHPFLAKAAAESVLVDVAFSSTEINSIEVTTAMQSDVVWAVGSILFVTAFMGLQLRSVPAMCVAFVVVFLSVPLAYVCVPTDKTTFASLMSVFLVTVIDIDIIFVFNDFWAQSASFKSVEYRLAWMLVNAGKSCLATSLTTSLSFFANLLSAMQPLREFGLFMGLCITNVYVLALLVLPPIFVVRHRRSRHTRRPGDLDLVGAVPSDRSEPPARNQLQETDASRSEPMRVEDKLSFIMLSRLIDCISTCPCMIIFVAVALMVAAAVKVALDIDIETTAPQIFQPDHNQVLGAELSSKFAPVLALTFRIDRPLEGVAVCRVTDHAQFDEGRSCDMHWCASPDQDALLPESVECWHGPVVSELPNGIISEVPGPSMKSCGHVALHTRFVADEVTEESHQTFISEWEKNAVAITQGSMDKVQNPRTFERHRPVVIEDWATGSARPSTLWKLSDMILYNMSAGNMTAGLREPACSMSTFCFAGTRRCDLPGWRKASGFNLTALSQVLPATSSRRLAPFFVDTRLPSTRRLHVEVVFGLWAPSRTPLIGATRTAWRFDPFFEPEDPWSQRAMFAMWSSITEELMVVQAECWVTSFKTWLEDRGRRFPSRDFNSDVDEWHAELGGTYVLWLVDGAMRACALKFISGFDKRSSAKKKLEYKEKWDGYVDRMNSKTSLTASRSWATSDVWHGAEAATTVVTSTVETVLTEFSVSWLCIMMFTGDPVLATIVLLLMLANTTWLMFFMVVVMKWTIGPIEIIFLVVFLGYSVTFGLHMAHNYSHVGNSDPALHRLQEWLQERLERRCAGRKFEVLSEAASPQKKDAISDTMSDGAESITPLKGAVLRQARVRLAMQRVGGAIVASTVSTLGSAAFLFMCQLRFFIRLGWIVMAVVTLSLLTSMFVLPAVLAVCGPGEHPCYKRAPRMLASACFERLRGSGRRRGELSLLD